MINILCYGDSNTWGDPGGLRLRYGRNVRWTGLLQTMLGDNYYVIEEGLNGRTTDLNDGATPVRNGLAYLPACIKSHTPLDWVFIMLGTNDLKARFNRSSLEIAQAIGNLVDTVRENIAASDADSLKICIMSPAQVNMQIVNAAELPDADQKLTELANHLPTLAKDKNCLFINIAPIAATGKDGVHFTVEAHKAVAEAVESIIRN